MNTYIYIYVYNIYICICTYICIYICANTGVPVDIKTLNERRIAFRYQRRILSKHLRFLAIGRWQMLKCIVTGIEYYYDEAKDELRFSLPSDATW
jgi:hypothetical protein